MNQSAGSVTPLSADEILTALGSGKWPVFRMDSVGGSANAITASVSGLTLTSGQYFWLVPASNSSSTTVNLNLNSGGNVRVKKADGSTDPASGDLQAGVIALLYYDGTYYRQMTGMPVSATNITGLTDGAGNSEQSYNYPGGLGDRSASITVTSSVGLFSTGNASGLVNGNIYDTSQYFGAGLDASSHWIKFDFGAARKITEAKWFQSGAASHGTWKWQGSNDDSSYTDVGTSFTLGSVTPQAHTSLTGNTVAYRYWKLVGVSGTTSSSPYINECEFKLNDSSAVSATSLSVPGQASFTGIAQFAALPVLPRQIASTFLGAPAGASDVPVFRYITRADISSLGLTPSDMPTSPYLEATKASGQTLSGSYNTMTWNTAGHNDCFTVASNVFTATVAGWYQVFCNLYANTSTSTSIAIYVNGAIYPGGQGQYAPASSVPNLSCPVYLGVGDTLTLKADAASGYTIDASNAGLRDLRVVWRGK